MNISECYNLHNIVRELELAMQIEDGDLKEKDMDRLIENVIKKINRQYQVDLTTYKVDAPELELSQFRESVALFVENIAGIHAKLCGYSQIKRYFTVSDVSLADINYLGYETESLASVIMALQRKSLIPKVSDAIASIKEKLPTISNSWEKRLLVLLVVCERLGFYEVVACIAEIFHQSLLR